MILGCYLSMVNMDVVGGNDNNRVYPTAFIEITTFVQGHFSFTSPHITKQGEDFFVSMLNKKLHLVGEGFQFKVVLYQGFHSWIAIGITG
jgi:hypothetical protein